MDKVVEGLLSSGLPRLVSFHEVTYITTVIKETLSMITILLMMNDWHFFGFAILKQSIVLLFLLFCLEQIRQKFFDSEISREN